MLPSAAVATHFLCQPIRPMASHTASRLAAMVISCFNVLMGSSLRGFGNQGFIRVHHFPLMSIQVFKACCFAAFFVFRRVIGIGEEAGIASAFVVVIPFCEALGTVKKAIVFSKQAIFGVYWPTFRRRFFHFGTEQIVEFFRFGGCII